MNFVELVKHNHVSPYSAELTTKVFDTLQSRHDSISKARNDLYAAVMKMPMHPDEKLFKLALLQEIQSGINDNITDPRNLNDDFDNIMRMTSEIMNDPVVTDRVSWYDGWLKQQQKIRDNKNLPESWKLWYSAKEQYRSPVGDGTPYTPLVPIIEPADKYEVFKKAVGITSPTKYGYAGNKIVKNAEGKMGYINNSGRFETLKAEDLWDSVKTIIDSDSKTTEQLLREYQIERDYGNIKIGNRDMSFPEWEFAQFAGMCEAKAHRDSYTSTKLSGFGVGKSGGDGDEDGDDTSGNQEGFHLGEGEKREGYPNN